MQPRISGTRDGGLLARLARDIRGNTLAIMAAALIPLTGMVGGGIDISRMYITKTRLQHACDAGALAGRRHMGAGTWGTDDSTVALQFFDANFLSGSYGSEPVTRSFSESAGKVTGTASAVLPMTLMKVLGYTTQTIAVTCDAQMQLPNTDVMFVLDTTGSMNCVAGDATCSNNGGVPATGSKIDGLKVAVKCFYEIVAQLDTDATCTTGTPSGGTSSAVQIRFGFMPYASNVNVGHLLPSNWFADSWTYQSRTSTGAGYAWSNWILINYTVYTGSCPQPPNTSTIQYGYGYAKDSAGKYYCANYRKNYGPAWSYGQKSISLTPLKSGTGWNSTYSMTLPIGDTGTNRTIVWDGCIEERQTVATTSYSPIPSTANDLNIDMVPTTGTSPAAVLTQWKPALSDVIYERAILNQDPSGAATTVSTSNDTYYQPGDYCPTEARKLQSWPDATAFDNYVNGLTAQGNTYHDIGMLWGARFMSPTGIFSSENATAASGGQIQRHMIFMTDGDSTSSPCDYNAYGVPFYDQRETTDVGAAADCYKNRASLIDQINLRLDALCTAVKNKGITLWVVSYGGDVNAATETRLSNCASPPDSSIASHYFKADDPATLQKNFAAIANNISQLRLTK